MNKELKDMEYESESGMPELEVLEQMLPDVTGQDTRVLNEVMGGLGKEMTTSMERTVEMVLDVKKVETGDPVLIEAAVRSMEAISHDPTLNGLEKAQGMRETGTWYTKTTQSLEGSRTENAEKETHARAEATKETCKGQAVSHIMIIASCIGCVVLICVMPHIVIKAVKMAA